MLWILFAVLAGGVAVAVSSKDETPPAPGGKLVRLAPLGDQWAIWEAEFQEVAKLGEEAKVKKEAEARASVGTWYDETTASFGSSYALYFKAMRPLAMMLFGYGIDATKAIAGLVSRADDWNSAEHKTRAQNAFQGIANLGFAPTLPIPGSTDDFASWADVMEQELAKLRELFSARPDVASLWSQTRGWLATPEAKGRIAEVRLIGAWPPPANVYDRNALAIATVIAYMRKKDPAKAREYVKAFLMTAPKEMRYWENMQWRLGGIIEAADKATK